MELKTAFNWIGDDWIRVKNHCRTTDNKEFTDKEATDIFKKKLLISEHSPIRLIEFDWSWSGIKYWVSQHWVRHKFEKFVSTQRDDRQRVLTHSRDESPQDTLVKLDCYANMQNLIDAWRKRLCFQCAKETRELAEDFKIKLRETHPLESDVLCPNCIYRCGCPEFCPCGFFENFIDYFLTEHFDKDITDIQDRYDVYNEMFYKMHERANDENDTKNG